MDIRPSWLLSFVSSVNKKTLRNFIILISANCQAKSYQINTFCIAHFLREENDINCYF